ncbi:MAG TPA: FtsX-like permease family protein [Actinomycetes bacterium]|jgi:putative ABC transport system permease protein|nr:FtsX-like permease family protein [Actinomycetes bacterium]
MYPNLTPTLAVLLGAALAVAAFIAIRRPFLRKLALRQIARRRGEAALVVIGSVLGTAIIIGSLIVGDTLNFSVKQAAYNNLGPIDEIVSSPTIAQGDQAARRVAGLRGDPDVDGILTLRGDQAAVTRGSGASRTAEPRASVWEVDFAQAAAFRGGVGGGSGLSGPAPGAGEAVINDDLATQLGARAGDTLTFYLYGRPTQARVARVVPTKGLAGAGTGQTAARNAFFTTGTLDQAARAAQAAQAGAGPRQPGTTTAGAAALAAGAGGAAAQAGAPPAAEPRTFTFVSNTGGVEEGDKRSDAVAAKLKAALGPLASQGTSVEKPKQSVLKAAEAAGNGLGSLFLFIGSFSVIAGVLLLVNIFVMLAEERKSELGMLRAVGMKRGRLVRSFIIEGTVYALVASLLGILIGLGVGRAVVVVAARIFSGFSDDDAFNLAFKFTPISIFNGFAMGFLIAFVTVALTSIRISRVNIIAAIRDLPNEGGRRLKRRWVVLSTVAAALFGALAAVAIARSQGVGVYLYPALAVLALCPLLVRLAPRRWVYSGASLAVLGWGLAANTLRPKVFDDGSTATFIVLGSLLTFSAVLLVSQNQELLTRPLRPLIARPSLAGLATRLAVAYPIARRFRTGAILIMYGLVVFTLVLITVIGNLISAGTDTEVRNASGGYAVRADFNPSAPVADPARAFTTGRFAGKVAAVAPLTVVGGKVTNLIKGRTDPIDAAVVGTDPTVYQSGLFPLNKRLARLGDDRAVWQAVQADPGYVILDPFLGEEGGGPSGVTYEPGDTLMLTDPNTGKAEQKTIAGVLKSSQGFFGVGNTGFLSPVIVSQSAARAQFGPNAKLASAFVKPAAGVTDQALAAELQGQYLPEGLVATQIRDQVERGFAANRGFFQLMQGFLALGLIVGIAGLGVVMVRAVRERRRTIGVLRALGFPSGTVQRAFLTESTFVALEGIVLGTALSIVTSYLLFKNDDELNASGVGFPIPWTSIAVLVLAAAAASVLATVWPARQAAKIRPAVALRIAD